MERGGSVYILTNKNNTVLYTGVTSDLYSRIIEHREIFRAGFTTKYNIDKLVYFENFRNIEEAIAREKQIKAGSRMNKVKLIESINLEWDDITNKI
ncbi:MAG: hypothetical protein COC01_06175 [Bacteroidetes bacterium]|nr:GIY-YIG nuclease family protein [Bacteroidia bacterium]MBN4052278.1 GIY-YIG nuclease family protein [Sphingobacteriaceae bacterium AH-315-L07]PCH67309.1 MAG: hypothetical protein COC01_06175 [Bacteroidota bacterium]